MRPPVVITHGGCWDGFAAAWLFSKAFPDAEFVFARHGDAPPPVAGRDVYIADFCYPRPVMLEIAGAAEKLVVLDHHKTAAAEMAGFEAEVTHRLQRSAEMLIRFEDGKSGGRLAWEYLVRQKLLPHAFLRTCPHISPDEASGRTVFYEPWLVRYTEDRDLWRWALPWSREVCAALRSFPLDFAEWDRLHLFGAGPVGMVEAGRAIIRREEQIVAQHVRHAREVEIGGHLVLAVNATVLTSEIAGRLAEGRPFGVCYFDREDGLRVWSLRSRDGGLDVSEIARARGGGGHRNAAGFETPIPVTA